ncbi:chromosome partitioning protein [Lentzea tibetensis]|uniref:Chromosome partitioning protein n=1 Tax=Lentzea tibetensis TaxID=2591470 RepID=A0A563EHF6_9PSEU|nr:chromosome partitioning protein [Lentzea tibetensis]TWP46054.1 chromosome partitioning protein [Lentzea tibetensis]
MLVAVLSLKGSPGVTTFSVALAARWPAPVRTVLVEADPSGGDIATRFCLPSTPGLLSLAAAARSSPDSELLWQHTQALPGGLPVVTTPPDADQARAALLALPPNSSAGVDVLRSTANAPDTVVIADCGRIDHGSAAMGIVRESDVLVLLTRAHADDLAHLARRLPAVGRWAPRAALLLVGEGYSTTEVSRELGVPPLGRVPHDERGAAVLCGRPPRSRWGRSAPSNSALGRFAHKVAVVLTPTPAAPPPSFDLAGADQKHTAVARSTPAAPNGAASSSGLRLAPSPPDLPADEQRDSQGGAAS